MLGYMYDQGMGVAKSSAQAFDWYLKAANQGYDEAQLIVGYMYFTGKGAKKNPAEAEAWLQKAVAQGNAKAQKMLDDIRIAKK